MATMQGTQSVAANATTANVIAGLLHEFVGNGAKVTISATGSVIGLNMTAILNIPVIQDQSISLQNRFPIIPDDVLYQGIVRACRVFMQFRNTTAGAIVVFWRVDVN
jgi:hypothetical protein